MRNFARGLTGVNTVICNDYCGYPPYPPPFPTLGIPHLPWRTIPPQPPKHPYNPHYFRQNAAVLEELEWWLWKQWFDIGRVVWSGNVGHRKSLKNVDYFILFLLSHDWAVSHHEWHPDVVFKPYYYYYYYYYKTPSSSGFYEVKMTKCLVFTLWITFTVGLSQLKHSGVEKMVIF